MRKHHCAAGVGGYRIEKLATNAVSEFFFPFRAPPCAAGVGGYKFKKIVIQNSWPQKPAKICGIPGQVLWASGRLGRQQQLMPSENSHVEQMLQSCKNATGEAGAFTKIADPNSASDWFTAQLGASRRRQVAGGQWFETFGTKNRWCFCIIPIQWAWIRGCMDVR